MQAIYLFDCWITYIFCGLKTDRDFLVVLVLVLENFPFHSGN